MAQTEFLLIIVEQKMYSGPMCFLTQSLKTHLASRFPSPLCPLIIKTKLPPGSLEVTQGVEFIHLICSFSHFTYICNQLASNIRKYG